MFRVTDSGSGLCVLELRDWGSRVQGSVVWAFLSRAGCETQEFDWIAPVRI